MRINKNNRITTTLGTYHRALETPTHIYFVNHQEGDENGCCKMYDRKMNLVSDNYFAYVGLTEDLTNGTYSWISKELKANVILHNEVAEKEYQYILK